MEIQENKDYAVIFTQPELLYLKELLQNYPGYPKEEPPVEAAIRKEIWAVISTLGGI